MDWKRLLPGEILTLTALIGLGVGVVKYAAPENLDKNCENYQYWRDEERGEAINEWYTQREGMIKEYLQKYLPEGCRFNFAYRPSTGQILLVDLWGFERKKKACPYVNSLLDSLPTTEMEVLSSIAAGFSPYSYPEFVLYASPRGVPEFYDCENND